MIFRRPESGGREVAYKVIERYRYRGWVFDCLRRVGLFRQKEIVYALQD